MNQSAMLLKLEIKRAMKNLKRLMLGALIIAGVIILIVVCCASLRKEKKVINHARVALVTNNNTVIESVGMDVISNMETAENLFEFIVTDEESAMNEFEKGSLSGVIIFPNNYISEIGRGDNVPAKVYLRTQGTSMALGMISELCSAAGSLLASTEANSYALQDMLKEYKVVDHRNEMIDDMDVISARVILSRDEVFNKITLVGEGEVSIALGYACSALVMLFLLWGMSCGTVLKSDSYVLTKKLEAGMIPVRKQLAYKFMALFILLATLYLIIFGLLFASYPLARELYMLVDIDKFAKLLLLFFSMIPVLLLATSIIMACFSLAANQIGGILLLFILTLVMGYSSGCLLPIVYIPKVIRAFGKVLPTHFMLKEATNAVIGTVDLKCVVIILAYALLFYLISVVAAVYKGRRV